MRNWIVAFIPMAIVATGGFVFAQAGAGTDEYLATADRYFYAKDYANARKYYAYVAKMDPDDAAALKGVGNCLYMQKRTQEAVAYFEKSLALNPGDIQLATFIQELKAQLSAAPASPPTGPGAPPTVPAVSGIPAGPIGPVPPTASSAPAAQSLPVHQGSPTLSPTTPSTPSLEPAPEPMMEVRNKCWNRLGGALGVEYVTNGNSPRFKSGIMPSLGIRYLRFRDPNNAIGVVQRATAFGYDREGSYFESDVLVFPFDLSLLHYFVSAKFFGFYLGGGLGPLLGLRKYTQHGGSDTQSRNEWTIGLDLFGTMGMEIRFTRMVLFMEPQVGLTLLDSEAWRYLNASGLLGIAFDW